jgi:hypothetical protein
LKPKQIKVKQSKTKKKNSLDVSNTHSMVILALERVSGLKHIRELTKCALALAFIERELGRRAWRHRSLGWTRRNRTCFQLARTIRIVRLEVSAVSNPEVVAKTKPNIFEKGFSGN